jgi:glucose/arabinose dehydrogenase
MKFKILPAVAAAVIIVSCGQKDKKVNHSKADGVSTPEKQVVDLPAPYQSKSVKNYCKVIGWPAGKTPVAPSGFTVSLFVDSLRNPRNIYIAPNGDILVSEAIPKQRG